MSGAGHVEIPTASAAAAGGREKKEREHGRALAVASEVGTASRGIGRQQVHVHEMMSEMLREHGRELYPRRCSMKRIDTWSLSQLCWRANHVPHASRSGLRCECVVISAKGYPTVRYLRYPKHGSDLGKAASSSL